MTPDPVKPAEAPALIKSRVARPSANSPAASPAQTQPLAADEKRRNRRSKMARPVLVKPRDPFYREEALVTENISRDGFYFATKTHHYYMGMPLGVTFPYTPGDPCNVEKSARVVRIDKLPDGRLGIALQLILA